MRRGPVDVVVPFLGTEHALHEVIARMRTIALMPRDSLLIVDNNRTHGVPERVVDGVRVLSAPEVQSSYFARNAGARFGAAPWIVFLDADVEPSAGLIDSYFAIPPRGDTGILAGAVIDGPSLASGDHSVAVRYAMLRRAMTHVNTLEVGRWSYAQTANCAVRRDAFQELGGFRDDVRSGGDADLCFRLRAAGLSLERRDEAHVLHRSRVTLRRMLGQRARHGAGAAWLNRAYPGAFPAGRWPGLVVFTLKQFAKALKALAAGQRDEAMLAYVEPLSTLAYELGRYIPNEVGRPAQGPFARGVERLLLG